MLDGAAAACRRDRTRGTRQRRAQVSAKVNLSASPHRWRRRAREIVAGDEHVALADAGTAAHHVGRCEGGERAALIVLGKAGDGTELLERALINEAGNALANGELPRGLVACHLVGAAKLQGQATAAFEIVELGLPGHVRLSLPR